MGKKVKKFGITTITLGTFIFLIVLILMVDSGNSYIIGLIGMLACLFGGISLALIGEELRLLAKIAGEDTEDKK